MLKFDYSENVIYSYDDYSLVVVDKVLYVFRNEFTRKISSHISGGWKSPLLYSSDAVYTSEKCIRNRLIDLETADFVYKTMGRLIISEKDLQNVKSDIKELVNKVL
tara:strand:+ start:2342 stop:2659 length:318 start_codon:yes stop_codon:yes gene_type:complete